MRHLATIFALALLVASFATSPVAAQGQAHIRFVVRDRTATPQRGIRITLDLGDGRGPRSHVTDDLGATERMISPTSLVTVTQVLDADRAPLSFEMTTLDGRLVLPLAGDLDVPWAYDRASRSVVSLPRTMSNEAFPELGALPADSSSQITLPGTPLAANTPAPIIIGGDGQPAGTGKPEAGGGAFWLIVAGLILSGTALGIWARMRVRATPRPRRDPRRRGGR